MGSFGMEADNYYDFYLDYVGNDDSNNDLAVYWDVDGGGDNFTIVPASALHQRYDVSGSPYLVR